MKGRARYTIRPIERRDSPSIARIIRTVMPEFGAKGPGYAIEDPEVDDMFGAYEGERAAYWVVVRDDEEVLGGGGFNQLRGAPEDTSELQKLYFLPALRGLKLGVEIIRLCITHASRAGYSKMYLETLPNMTAAQRLYEQNGFLPIPEALGNTGHYGCKSFYLRELP